MEKSKWHLISVERSEIVSNYSRKYLSSSVRKVQTYIETFCGVIQSIRRNMIRMFTLKLDLFQALELGGNYKTHLDYAHKCFYNLKQKQIFVHNIIFSDDCIYHVRGKAQSHNGNILDIRILHETCFMFIDNK